MTSPTCEHDLLRLAFKLDQPADTPKLTVASSTKAYGAQETLRIMLAGARLYADLNRPFSFWYVTHAIARNDGKWDV